MTQTLMERHPNLRQLIGLGDSMHSIANLHQKLEHAYDRLAASLPSDHAWKTVMRESGERSETAFLAIADRLGCTDIERGYIGLLVYSHGLGRLVEAANREYGLPTVRPHGQLCEEVVTETLMLDGEHPFWNAACYAIRHRPDVTTPSPDQYPDEEWRDATSALTGILRDCIKREGLSQPRLLLNTTDPKTKLDIRNMTYPQDRLRDPLLGVERRQIVPEVQLERFEQHLPLIRPECESYEALMLQILAYLYDVVHPEFLQIIVEEGGPSTLYRYLINQLVSTAPGQLKRIGLALIAWNPEIAATIERGAIC